MLWQVRRGLISGRGAHTPAASGDAALTTAFLARTVTGGAVSAVLNGTHLAAVKAFLNGIVSDGIDGNFDTFNIIAMQSVGGDGLDVARLNMIQNAFNLTGGTGMTFVADRGITDDSSHFLDTGFTPSTAGGKYGLNDAMLGLWGNGAGTTADMGWDNGGPTSGLGMQSGATLIAMNGGTIAGFSSATPNGTGFLVGTRTNSTTLNGYWAAPNAGSVTSLGTATVNSSSLTTGSIAVCVLPGQNFSGRQISAAWIGKAMNATDIGKLYTRLQAYMTAVGN